MDILRFSPDRQPRIVIPQSFTRHPHLKTPVTARFFDLPEALCHNSVRQAQKRVQKTGTSSRTSNRKELRGLWTFDDFGDVTVRHSLT